ncbi:hypothetical protein [Cystobacter ferrugineus]|uniref:Uncharacterized protein n=1 Tax=Cystobacter ferrugineus TaxID=83449 RepID=A0A1L9BDY0_9BACT|nr:hypothetical protein [Cystobacter ferrugineus]OJH40445.1 hypothetical protein BON30_15635 [Cystobacter ferrugineus]
MKPAPSRAPPASPVALRVIHGIVFGGLTAICVVAGMAEFEHLWRTQVQPFHAGPPPRPALVLAMLTTVVAMGVILVQSLRGRSARLLWSLFVLAGLVFTLWDTHEGPVPGRSTPSANLKILQVARALHGRMVEALQTRGALPEDAESWQEALQQVAQGQPTPVRTRSFTPLPFRIQKVDSLEALPPEAPPGTVFLYVVEGGVAYELQAVGLSPEGGPWRLLAPNGDPVVFRGAYNPDLAPASGEGGSVPP